MPDEVAEVPIEVQRADAFVEALRPGWHRNAGVLPSNMEVPVADLKTAVADLLRPHLQEIGELREALHDARNQLQVKGGLPNA